MQKVYMKIKARNQRKPLAQGIPKTHAAREHFKMRSVMLSSL